VVFIGVLSGRGGVGKTTVAINIAAALNLRGRSTVLVDGDLWSPHVGMYLGAPFTEHTVNDVLRGEKSVFEVAHAHPSGLKVIPAEFKFEPLPEGTGAQFAESLEELDCAVEAVIIDCPSGMREGVFSMLGLMNALIIVTNPDLPSVTDALKLIVEVEKRGRNVMGVVVNRWRGDAMDLSIENIEAFLKKGVMGVLPDKDCFREALHVRQPIVISHPESASASVFFTIADGLIRGTNATT